MNVNTLVVGSMNENCYILCHEESGEVLIFDPGDEADKIYNFIDNKGYKPVAIFLTHGHFDHIGACNKLKEYYDIPILVGQGEQLLLNNPKINLSTLFGEETYSDADNFISGNENIVINNFNLLVISTPGHTPGGVCYYFEKENILFTGDTLFNGSIGRTDFPYGDTNQLLESIKKLNVLPDDTVVYTGHGESTTIGYEKENNPYMSNRDIL